MAKKKGPLEKYGIRAKTLPEGVLITDERGTLTYVNPALEEMFGIPSSVSLGTHFRKYVTPASAQNAEALFLGCAQGKIIRDVELEAVHQDQHTFPIEIAVSPILRDGKFQGVESVVRDITERKRAEKSLRESERRFRSTFENAAVGIAHIALDGRILQVNSRFCAIVGYSSPEILGRTCEEITPTEDWQAEQNLLQRLRDGNPVWVNLTRMLENRVAQRTAELQQRARQLERITVELSETEGRERRRLAEILHDDLQQELAAAKFHVGRMRSQARYDASLQATAAQVDHMLKNAIAKSRSLSHELSPAVMHHADFAETLRWLANEAQTKHGLVVHVAADSEVRSESEAIKALLFRAA